MSRLLTRTALVAAISGFLTGDLDAFGDVFSHYRAEVLRVATFEIPSLDLAEDVVSDTFLDLYLKPGSFPSKWDGSPEHFCSFLLKAARFRCLRAHCRWARGRWHQVPFVEEETPERLQGVCFEEKCEQLDEVEFALSVLEPSNPKGARILRLRFVADLSVREVSRELELGEQTVMNRTVQALQELRRLCGARYAG